MRSIILAVTLLVSSGGATPSRGGAPCTVREIYRSESVPIGTLALDAGGDPTPIYGILRPSRLTDGSYEVRLSRAGDLWQVDRGDIYLDILTCLDGPSIISSRGVLRVGTANRSIGRASIEMHRY